MNTNTLRPIVGGNYLAFLLARNLKMAHWEVTRPASRSCLDDIAIPIRPGIWRTPLFSDHYPVFVFLQVQEGAGVSDTLTFSRRVHTKENIDAYGESPRMANWIGLHQAADVNSAFQSFREQVASRYHSCCELGPHSEDGPRNGVLRFSDALKRLRTNVNKLDKRFRKTGDVVAKAAYHRSCSLFRLASYRARKDHFKGRFHELKGDPAALWRFIGGSIGRQIR